MAIDTAIPPFGMTDDKMQPTGSDVHLARLLAKELGVHLESDTTTGPSRIAAADRAHPPVFTGANTGLHLSNPGHVELHGLAITKIAHNGLNIDDSGSPAETRDTAPTARHIVLRGLRITDI